MIEEVNYQDLSSGIYESCPDILVLERATKNEIPVLSIEMIDGEITEVVAATGVHYTPEEIEIIRQYLQVPGIGNIISGTRVIYHDKDYVLLFGWHTNISNQTIYSWYLEALEEDVPPKTLYQEMIDEIDTLHFR